jgi:hypothetical protein
MADRQDRSRHGRDRNFGQANQGRPGTHWGNQGNHGNEGWHQGYDQPQGMWGTRVPGPGGYAGVGPKNYTRSDERIGDEVSQRLTEDDRVDASEIEVRVSGGEVTLLGEVDTRQTKKAAEDVVWPVRGVTQVHNQLKARNAPGQFFNNREQSGYRMLTNPRRREP